MKHLGYLLLCLLFPFVGITAQNDTEHSDTCAPVVNGKVCYQDKVRIKGLSQKQLFDILASWARKSYGKDVFLSNVITNEENASIYISSKVELLLNETDKTALKYKMNIHCYEDRYEISLSQLLYQYNPTNERMFRNYPAEDIILNEGRDNRVEIVKHPHLFCEATSYFVHNLFDEILEFVNDAEL